MAQVALVGVGLVLTAAAAIEILLVIMLVRQHGRIMLAQQELSGRLQRIEARLAPASQAPSGLPVGSEAPRFVLPDLAGKERRLEEFLGQPVVLAFFSTTCGYCLQLAPRLRHLPSNGIRMVLVSQGGSEQLQKLAREHEWHSDVLLQNSTELMIAYRANGTPTGYLLDAQGRIASALAIGADALLSLLGEPAAEPKEPERLTAKSLRQKEQTAAERMAAAGLAVTESKLNRAGLAPGEKAPDFTLSDAEGIFRSLADFRGKQVLLLFSDPNCGPCQTLAPSLVRFKEHAPANTEVIMVSGGDADANRAKIKQHGLNFPVLLQKHWEVSKAYAMFATPVAYLIDSDGRLEREVAVGPEAVESLLGSLRRAQALQG